MSTVKWKKKKFSVERYERTAIKQGFYVNSASKEFLLKYGGLNILEPGTKFHFDAIEAIRGISSRTVNYYKQRLSAESLSVIGEDESFGEVLLTDSDGTMYSAFDDLLSMLGKTGDDGIINLCLRKKRKKILDWE